MLKFNSISLFGSTYTTTATADVTVSATNAVAIFLTYTNVAPAAKTFAPSAVDATANTITLAAHGLVTGLKGQMTTVTTLPGGLSTSTDYFVVVVDANTIKLASTLPNALDGTAIDLTTQGTGNHTFTPTALAGASVKLQASADGVTWADLTSKSANITATGSTYFELADVAYPLLRVSFTATAGQVALSGYACFKEA